MIHVKKPCLNVCLFLNKFWQDSNILCLFKFKWHHWWFNTDFFRISFLAYSGSPVHPHKMVFLSLTLYKTHPENNRYIFWKMVSYTLRNTVIHFSDIHFLQYSDIAYHKGRGTNIFSFERESIIFKCIFILWSWGGTGRGS